MAVEFRPWGSRPALQRLRCIHRLVYNCPGSLIEPWVVPSFLSLVSFMSCNYWSCISPVIGPMAADRSSYQRVYRPVFQGWVYGVPLWKLTVCVLFRCVLLNTVRFVFNWEFGLESFAVSVVCLPGGYYLFLVYEALPLFCFYLSVYL